MALTATEWANAWAALLAQERGRPREAFIPDFRSALNRDPTIFYIFEKFALEVVAAGFTRFSADMIYQRMRWYASIEARKDPAAAGDEFRLNDHFRSLLARLFILVHPDHRGLFEFRERQ